MVSIITPSYNQGQFIEDTILSVKNQDYPAIEHIIVDGESKDNTLEILKKYKDKYNMYYISEPDNGQADAINKGLRISRGTILTWLNSDDYYLNSQVIKKVVSYFKLYESIHVITGNGYYVNKESVLLKPIVVKKKHIDLKHMRYSDLMLQPATFFKRSVLKKVSINQNYSYIFDWLLFLNIFEKKFNVLAVDDFFSAYRIYSDNKTTQDKAVRKREIVEMAKRNFGPFSARSIYCYIIYWLYCFFETLPRPIGKYSKSLVRKINFVISKITANRIYSD